MVDPSPFQAANEQSGRANGLRTNGLSYGWLNNGTATARTDAQIRRFHPLPQYDTMAHMGTDTWSWRIALPNGTYPVAIVASDATSLAHTNNLVVNGVALTPDPDPGNASTVPAYEQGDFDGWLIAANVTDGFLTIQAGAGAFDPTLTHLEIGQIGQPITPDMHQRLTDQVLAATQRTAGSPFWNGGRTETRTYVWDPAYIDHLIAYQRTNTAGTQTYYAHSGAQYSVQAVTDSNGAVVEKYTYSAYGERTIEGGSNGGRSAIGLTTGFTGRDHDDATGTIYFRKRIYNPDYQFLNRDPAGYVDGTSLYRGYFVPGGTDPYGLFCGKWFVYGVSSIKLSPSDQIASGETEVPGYESRFIPDSTCCYSKIYLSQAIEGTGADIFAHFDNSAERAMQQYSGGRPNHPAYGGPKGPHGGILDSPRVDLYSTNKVIRIRITNCAFGVNADGSEDLLGCVSILWTTIQPALGVVGGRDPDLSLDPELKGLKGENVPYWVADSAAPDDIWNAAIENWNKQR